MGDGHSRGSLKGCHQHKLLCGLTFCQDYGPAKGLADGEEVGPAWPLRQPTTGADEHTHKGPDRGSRAPGCSQGCRLAMRLP